MIVRDANVNFIGCYGEEEAEKRLNHAQAVTNNSTYKFYDADSRSFFPSIVADFSEESGGSGSDITNVA